MIYIKIQLLGLTDDESSFFSKVQLSPPPFRGPPYRGLFFFSFLSLTEQRSTSTGKTFLKVSRQRIESLFMLFLIRLKFFLSLQLKSFFT